MMLHLLRTRLHRFRVIAGTLCLATVLAGCGGSSPAPLAPPGSDIPHDFASFAVVLRLEADARLNWYGDAPSSLALCVYQLTDRKALELRLKTPEGMRELVECRRFDDSVVTFERIFIDPGQVSDVFLDRQRNTRWIALAAGYFEGAPERSVLMAEVPVRTITKGWIPFLKTTRREADQLVLHVRLGPTELLSRDPAAMAEEPVGPKIVKPAGPVRTETP